jgi:hypothetical protein
VIVFSGVLQQNFAGAGLFAGMTLISKTVPAKFKMRQQNFRCPSKIINPNEFLTRHVKKCIKIML